MINIVNNPITKKQRETIEQLSKKSFPISYIAKKTKTCRPTVRKYQELMETP